MMALVTVQTQKLRRAVIYMGLFSLCISFVYMLYNAPDVAIAEAVIGSTLATILYLVALKKYKVFSIYYHVHTGEVNDTHYAHHKYGDFIELLEIFCAKQELEPHIIYTTDEKEVIMETHLYSLIIEDHNDQLTLYTHPENCKTDVLKMFLEESGPIPHTYTFIPCYCEVVE